MKRKQIYLPEDLNQKLQALSEAKGVPQSEIIREGLEAYLVNNEEKEKHWQQFLEQMEQSELKDLAWDRASEYAMRGIDKKAGIKK